MLRCDHILLFLHLYGRDVRISIVFSCKDTVNPHATMTRPDCPSATRAELDAPMAPLAEKALEWLVFLHSGQETDADWAAYEDWRASGVAERKAAEQAERLWAGIGPALRRPRAGLPRRSVLAGAGIALVGGAGLAAFLGMRRDLFADVRTAVSERRTLTLADGTRIELDAATSLDLHYSAKTRRIELLEGRIFVSVAADPNRPFIVDAGGGAARALGTAFEISRSGDMVNVVVSEHTVRVCYPRETDGPHVDVDAGSEVEFSRAGGLARPHAADVVSRMSWRNGLLAFQDRPLAEVVAQISRYRHGRIVIVDGELARLPVSGLFESADTTALLDALSAALPVTIDQLPWLTLIRRDASRPLEPFTRRR